LRHARGERLQHCCQPIDGRAGTYNETYGSLGAAIGFMTWLWISSIAVLIGAEVDAAMERRPFSDAPAALELN
jgi:uncharacterized BrkB/YihY/UPF0761 family membrane protein